MTIQFWFKVFGWIDSEGEDPPGMLMYIMNALNLIGTIVIGGGLTILQLLPLPPILVANLNMGTAIGKFTDLLNEKLDDLLDLVKEQREKRKASKIENKQKACYKEKQI